MEHPFTKERMGEFLIRVRARLKTNLITGLVVMLTTALTFWIFATLLKWADRFFGLREDPLPIPGLGVVIVVVVLLIVGTLVNNVLGRKLLDLWEKALSKIPVVNSFYGAFKQLFTSLFVDNSSFSRVVLVEYPRRGIYSLAFVTGETKGEISQVTEEDTINIFVPTTPNPTSGFYLAVPKTDVVELKMDIDDAFRIIMSAGIVSEEVAAERAERGEGDVVGISNPSAKGTDGP